MTQTDWDDDRLDAAFHARFDRPAPAMLTESVHVLIAGTSPARFARPRLGRAWIAAAAAVVVVAVAVTAMIGLGGSSPSGASPIPSSAATSQPGQTATPTEQAVAGSVFDGALPIIGVREAIALRDAGTDDSEIAVHGWFTPSIAPALRCAFVHHTSPLESACGDQPLWLAEDAESLIHVSNGALTTASPNGLAIKPVVDGLDTSWYPALPALGVDGGSTPTDVVLVGHFDDRRAELCRRTEIDACRDRFVVDSVAIVRGVPTNVAPVYQNSTKGRSSANDIEAIVGNEAPGSPILSITVVDGPDGLATFEPSLSDGQQGLIHQPTVWLVRVLESERAVTYIVIDGSDAIYEMNPEGEAILVGGTPPSAAATSSPGPWPPADALVLDIPGTDVGKPPVRVAIVDESGRFVSAMQRDPVTFAPESRFGATAEPGKQGQVNLAWVGGICDSQITITIAADLRSITFDMGPQPVCDSIGVEHQLTMYFTGTVDVPAIQIGEGTASETPVPTEPPAYTLECLTFAPDDCQRQAAQVIAATPSQRVVAFKIVDRCGSYRLTFSDGTSSNTVVGCVLGTETAPSPQASGGS